MKMSFLRGVSRTSLQSLVVALGYLALPGQAAETAAPASVAAALKSDADKAYDALYAGYREKLPEGVDPKKREYWEFIDKKFSKFAEDGLAFAKNFPDDPRRWEAIVQMAYTAPIHLKGFKPEFDEKPVYANVELDAEATAAFRKEHEPRMIELIEASDATDRRRTAAFQWLCLQARVAAASSGGKVDLSKLGPLTDRFVEKLPTELGAEIAGLYLDFLKQADPAAGEAFAEKIKSTPVGAEIVAKKEREEAEQKRIAEVRETEIGKIKFTAVDGTEVDLAQMKGKVVLIDFWATWCGPCIAEIPNVVENYKKYHDKGFEVIGITLERDEDAKKKMVAFTKEHGMVWPQYFDGKFWENDLGRKFGINAIPAMFLLDKEGKIASSNARGAKLEQEIKRLLDL